jgi:hypothetical protein
MCSGRDGAFSTSWNRTTSIVLPLGNTMRRTECGFLFSLMTGALGLAAPVIGGRRKHLEHLSL